jgi:hypothetical protein
MGLKKMLDEALGLGLESGVGAFTRTTSREGYELEGCDIVWESDAAVLVETKEEVRLWIPLSQVMKITRRKEAKASSVRMTAWIAKQKGLR